MAFVTSYPYTFGVSALVLYFASWDFTVDLHLIGESLIITTFWKLEAHSNV